MAIKYLAISGGGAAGLGMYGVLKYLFKKDFININNIKAVYATSVGTIVALLFLLKLECETMDDYLIKRPWENVFNIHPDNILNIFNKKGLLNNSIIKEVVFPLLTSCNLKEEITLKEFYEYSGIELYLYTVNINEKIPVMVGLSHKNYPNLELYKAISMSAAIPIVFEPIYHEDGCFVDGGLLNNYPLSECIKDLDKLYDENELLGIRMNNPIKDYKITNEMSFHEYIYNLIKKMQNCINTIEKQKETKYTIYYTDERNNPSKWHTAIFDKNIRQEMISMGEECAEKFLKELEDTRGVAGGNPHTPIIL